MALLRLRACWAVTADLNFYPFIPDLADVVYTTIQKDGLLLFMECAPWFQAAARGSLAGLGWPCESGAQNQIENISHGLAVSIRKVQSESASLSLRRAN